MTSGEADALWNSSEPDTRERIRTGAYARVSLSAIVGARCRFEAHDHPIAPTSARARAFLSLRCRDWAAAPCLLAGQVVNNFSVIPPPVRWVLRES